MDFWKTTLNTLRANLIFAIALIVIAIVGAVVHYSIQKTNYTSDFKTSNGEIDYVLFKNLMDFRQISADAYPLEQAELDTLKNALAPFRISFTQEGQTSIAFKANTQDKNANHKAAEKTVIRLINTNRFVQNSVDGALESLTKKLNFLETRISQLDSIMINPATQGSISQIPSDAYTLYAEQLEVEEEIRTTGKFELIKPVTTIQDNKRPIALLIVLYMAIAGFIFVVFSKKVAEEK